MLSSTSPGCQVPLKNRLRACSICRRTFRAKREDQWRCDFHQIAYDRAKDAIDRLVRPYDHAERLEHAAILDAWVEANGAVCPGLDDHRGHLCRRSELTVHHLEAVGDGGSRVGGPKMVLCVTENQRRGGQLGGSRSRP
jgi:hypothetical protein